MSSVMTILHSGEATDRAATLRSHAQIGAVYRRLF
jgi:hypothetical protein